MGEMRSYPRFAFVTCLILLLPTIALAQNAIVLEDQLTGNPPSEWDIAGAGDFSIQGNAADVSIDQGQTIGFKVKTGARE